MGQPAASVSPLPGRPVLASRYPPPPPSRLTAPSKNGLLVLGSAGESQGWQLFEMDMNTMQLNKGSFEKLERPPQKFCL